jgi:hypothetical protein
MTATVVGLHSQGFSRDEEGYRHYTVAYKVRTDSYLDGPQQVLIASGLAAPGTVYHIDNDYDAWAFCTPEMTIQAAPELDEGDPVAYYIVTQNYTNKPLIRCQTNTIENPILEPYKLSGDFIHERYTPRTDRFGNALVYSNYEPMSGDALEISNPQPQIRIEFNAAVLPLGTYTLIIGKVNDATLWDLPPRTILLTEAKWERLLYGTCYYYYRTTYGFDIKLDTHDPLILHEGYKTLREGGDPSNPADYDIYKMAGSDENTEKPVMLDSDGAFLADGSEPHKTRPQLRDEANFLLLGIPTTLA